MKRVLLALVLAACSADESVPQVATPAPAALTWKERVSSELSSMETAKRDELAQLAPQATPAGPRFTVELVRDPHATAVFIDRLARKTDAEDVRVALAEALPRTGGLYADAVADLFVDEGSALVRTAYVVSARRAPADQALSILRRAFADTSVEVRAEAARSAAAVTAVGMKLASELRMALSDVDATLRVEAARTLGSLRIEAAKDDLNKALADSSADVRLEAMRALDRITPGSLAGTATVVALQSDPDERVSRLAKQLTVRQ
jgi:HEAT repeat protein